MESDEEPNPNKYLDKGKGIDQSSSPEVSEVDY
jgi:hypothetical protein